MKKIISVNLTENAIIGLKAEAQNSNRSVSNLVDKFGIDLYNKNKERSKYTYEKTNKCSERQKDV